MTYTPIPPPTAPIHERPTPQYPPTAQPGTSVFRAAFVFSIFSLASLIVSFVLYIYYMEGLAGNTHDWDSDWDQIIRAGAYSGYALHMGTVLMVVSVVLLIRGFMSESQRQRFGLVIANSLPLLQVIALLAVILYAIGTFFDVAYRESWLDAGGFTAARLMYYPITAAFVFLAALPLIVANAMQKASW